MSSKQTHRLEWVRPGRGMMTANCTCGQTYRNPGTRSGWWNTWDADKIRNLHRNHKESAK